MSHASSEVAPSARASQARAERRADHLRLVVREGAPALLFHWFWLKHNALEAVHATTRERVLDPRDVPLDVRPRAVSVDDHTLVIEWPDGVSRFPIAWLEEHAYGREETPLVPPPHDVDVITLRALSLDGDLAQIARAALTQARRDRAVVVRGAGLDTEAIIDALAALGLSVRTTHFGRIEDLRTDNTTNANTDQLGYTDATIDLHTDQPFLEHPPRYQLLHGIRAADEGGESVVVDAHASARYLRAVDADSFEVLTRTDVTFHRKQKGFEKILRSPLLRLDEAGELAQVRHSYFTFAPFREPFDRTERFYRAYQRFARIVHEPTHQWRFVLEPGDFVLYDNHLALHARTGFRGPRWVRGVYFDEVPT
ncbi:MAG: TauD/TfdA family dioxygenase [Deltaproteobacteria bacterium]|nr:TauD/TfdA family dioxygenase [Deltaproteobacteria bacterium]